MGVAASSLQRQQRQQQLAAVEAGGCTHDCGVFKRYASAVWEDDAAAAQQGGRSGSGSSIDDCESEQEGASWGFFALMEEVEGKLQEEDPSALIHLEPPREVFEESLEEQELWYQTAGKRPRQPVDERSAFEALWRDNFAKSCVTRPASDSSDSSPIMKRRRQSGSSPNPQVIAEGWTPAPAVAGARCFSCPTCSTSLILQLRVTRFRVVSSGSGDEKHAEYLVNLTIGKGEGERDVTYGAWKRHSDFRCLAEGLSEQDYPRSTATWKKITQRCRWGRCLDERHLILKTMLLGRFLHDTVMESSAPAPLRKFLGFSLQ
jgi:hypothetical protein